MFLSLFVDIGVVANRRARSALTLGAREHPPGLERME